MMRSLLTLLASLALCSSVFAKGDLDAYGVSVNDTNPDPGDTVTVTWTAINRTGDYIGGSQQGVMFSSNSTIARGDTLLEKEYVGPLGGVFADTSRETRVVRIPTWAVPGREYWIGIYADYDRDREESKENNNNSSGVRIIIRAPDLYATDLGINDDNPDPGDFVTVSWTARSRNDIPSGSCDQGVVLSSDGNIDSGYTLLEREPLGALGGILAASTPELRTITIPDSLIPGQTYYLGVILDYDNEVIESNESNNNYLAGSFTVRGPDLIAQSLSASTDLIGNQSTSITTWPGDSLHLIWTARNIGDGSSALFNLSQQGIRWSHDATIDRSDPILEREALGILTPNDDSVEAHTIEIPADAQIGRTYYIGVEADTDQEFTEYSEDNNFSNVISVTISSPVSSSSLDIMDFNHLPWLEGEGLEADDPRLRDNTGDGRADPGVTMNSSRCFSPGDKAYVNLDVALDSDYTNLLNLKEDIELTAWYNNEQTSDGWSQIGSMTLAAGDKTESLNLAWNLPNAIGEYYVYVIAKIKIEGEWNTFLSEWIDPENPVLVRDSLPVVLVHGWSDVDGETFADLEFMIETLWERPVRSFGYETDKFAVGTRGNGPRVDQSYTEILGEEKPSLADQLLEFLDSPEGDHSTIARCDIVAHSMGGLVSRNYALKEEKVRRLVTFGTPNYGGLFSDTFVGDLALNNQAEDLEAGARLTWDLHREWQENSETLPNLLAIVGCDDAAPGIYNQSDILVTCSSASLENLGYPVYYVPLPHTDLLGKTGMAQIDGTDHPGWAPLEAFLNSENCALPDTLPGHRGGADDVGHKDHIDPLTSGALYILNVRAVSNLKPIVSVTLGHTTSSFLIEKSDIHNDGIFFANMVEASDSSIGSKYFTTEDSDIFIAENEFATRSLQVFAGETTVHALNGNNNPAIEGDRDGDGLPDCIEDLIIAADESDDLERHFDVSPFDDYDGDSLPELLEAALGTDPTRPDYAHFTTEIRNGYFHLRHRESHSHYGLTIVCEHTTNLASPDWSTANLTSEIIESDATGRLREWKIPVNGTSQFFRIHALPAE